MEETDINECFRLFKLRRGADFESVKRAYRKNLYRCHPDRFQNRPDLLPVAEQKAKRLIHVYGVLERWYEANAGIDPVPPFWQQRRSPGPANPSADSQEETSARALGLWKWRKVAIGAVGVGLMFGAWLILVPNGTPPKPRVAAQPTETAPAAPIPEASPAPTASLQDGLVQLRAAVAVRAAELSAASKAGEKTRAEWITAYRNAAESELGSSRVEWNAAQAQYKRDVLDAAADIEKAESETARQTQKAEQESASERAAFGEAGLRQSEDLKSDYDKWLLLQGTEAVDLVRKIRERDHSPVGVFSDTEDPRKIFEFWTAEEAGGPEVSIAAKTGVTVLQPDDRFFPHFRSNINLYDAEGKRLVRMMESIIDRHRELLENLEAQRLANEARLARWDEVHLKGAVRLEGALAQVLDRRNLATDRLAKARIRLERAALAAYPPNADKAFEQSGAGREGAVRVAKARAGLAEARRDLAIADPASGAK